MSNRLQDMSPPNAANVDALSPDQTVTLKAILGSLFDRCGTPYKTLSYDVELHELCLQHARERGYPLGNGVHQVNPDHYLRCGVNMASAAFRHLSRVLQTFVALYTAFVIWMDDMYAEGLEGIDLFYERFVSGRKQCSEGLDGMAKIMQDIPSVYSANATQASMIVMSTLRFFCGSMLEREEARIQTPDRSRAFSMYLRATAGCQEAFALFIFPPEISIHRYMQAIPDICDYINYYNDAVSFYKEEKAGDTANFISLEAASSGEDKLVVLGRLADEVVSSNQKALNLLKAPELKQAFDTFKTGYLHFHCSSEKRYRLGELFGNSKQA